MNKDLQLCNSRCHISWALLYLRQLFKMHSLFLYHVKEHTQLPFLIVRFTCQQRAKTCISHATTARQPCRIIVLLCLLEWYCTLSVFFTFTPVFLFTRFCCNCSQVDVSVIYLCRLVNLYYNNPFSCLISIRPGSTW